MPDRLTASTITDKQLDQLYTRLARAERAVRRAEGSESWMAKHLARQDSRVHGLTRNRDQWRQRAERAEAAIARVRKLSELTIAHSVRVQAIDQARDTLAALDGTKEQ